MCFPTIEGEIEVEERRPRYEGEVGRKRTRIVKESGLKNFDDRPVITPSPEGLQAEESGVQGPIWQQQQQQRWHQPYHPQSYQQQQLGHQQLSHEQQWQSLGFQSQPQVPSAFQRIQHSGNPKPAIERVQHDPRQVFGAGFQRVQECNRGKQGNGLNQAPPCLIGAGPRARLPQHLRANARRHKSKSRERSRHGRRGDRSTDSDDSVGSSCWHGRHVRRRSDSLDGYSSFDSFEDFRRPRRQPRSARRMQASRR